MSKAAQISGRLAPAQKPLGLPERISAPRTSASSSQRAMRPMSRIAASENMFIVRPGASNTMWASPLPGNSMRNSLSDGRGVVMMAFP